MTGRMDDLIKKVVRDEIRTQFLLGFGSGARQPLDVEPGTDSSGLSWIWGVYDHNKGALTPQAGSAVTGYFEGIALKEGSYKGKPTYKLAVFLDLGAEKYSIRSGLNSTFSKGVLNSLLGLRPKVGDVIRIVGKLGDDDSGKVVLPRLYRNTTDGFRWAKPKYEGSFSKEGKELYGEAIAAGIHEFTLGDSGGNSGPPPSDDSEAAPAYTAPCVRSAAPTPAAKKPLSEAQTRIIEIVKLTSTDFASLKRILVHELGFFPSIDQVKSESLSADQVSIIRDTLYAKWAMTEGLFNEESEALGVIASILKSGRIDPENEDAGLWEAWQYDLQEKKAA